MKKLLLLAILGGCAAAATAQNLLSNPGFEQKTSCPDNTGQIAKSVGWYSYTKTTPDYYNTCNAIATNFDIPSNIWGTQSQPTPATEEAYVGIFTRFLPGNPNYKEYIRARISALQVGKQYEMTINVSLGDYCEKATDGLGVHFFAAGDTFRNDLDPIYLTPMVSYDSYGVITNNSGWTKLTKTFTADSAYTHMIIGCFKNDTVLNEVTVAPGQQPMTYYYIDDVELKLVVPNAVGAETLADNVRLYPNPSNGSLKITLPQAISGPASLTAYNMMGQKLFETSITPGNNSIDLPATMINGTYLAEIKTEDGVKTMRFALQR